MYDPKDLNVLKKAYDNREFLHSAQARSLRILAEYLEPQARLRVQKIRGTIVMFGSARAQSPEKMGREVRRLRQEMDGATEEKSDAILRHINTIERLSHFYADAAELSFLLTQYYQGMPDHRDRHVICSGGGPGIMEAANRGAVEAGGKTIGFGVSLPHEQSINRFLEPRYSFEFHYFFMRKYWFMYLARALIVFPGGFGTMDELFEMMTLIQTQKVSKKLPIVLYGASYWNEAVNFQAMVDWGVVSPEDLNLFKICNTPGEAFEYLKGEIDGGLSREPEDTPGA